jgi:CheY-like chemotaxis protein
MDVTCCGDGRQALAAWQGSHPDVVMLDLTLPGLDGLQVLEQARRSRPGDTGADPDRARHGGRPHHRPEHRRRRLPAQTV